MLMLNTAAWTIEGVQVFADHADQSQFWYLPGPVRLARRRQDGRADLTFIKVRAADAASAARGGGFLTFTTDLALDPALEARILSKLSSVARGRPRLAAVPFDEGSVRVIALDLDSGATPGAPPPDGAFRAVERALGATVPSLDAVNRASFALTLTQEGAIIIEKALEQGGTPVGVIYELKYSGMRPALDVTITADMSRVFDQFAASADSQVLFVRGGIDAGFEKLVQSGAIKIEVHDFIGAADRESKETWALDFFKEQLLAQYFTPSLTVGELRGGMPQTESLDAVMRRADALRPPATPAPARPTADETVTRPSPPADPADSATAGTGRGGKPADRVANPPATSANAAADSPTAHTGHAASSATAAEMGSSAAAGVAPAVTAARPPGVPAGAATQQQGSGGAAPPRQGSGDATAPAAQREATPVASFRMRTIRQEERKTLSFRYSRSEATQRTYAPQGFFGLLAGDLDRAGHFIEVDLDDPFFRAMEIRVSTVPDMAAIGLRAAEVALIYGTPADPGGVKAKDMRFAGQEAPEQTWTIFQNDGEEQVYRYTVQFHFDEASGFEGSSLSYEFGPFETSDRTLILNPHAHLGFMTVSVVANKVDWGQIERIEVELAAGDRRKTVTLTEAQKEAAWKLRLDDPAQRTIRYKPTFVMKDRTTVPGTEAVAETSGILIDDPFPAGLALQLIPILDPGRTRLAFVDFEYTDPGSGFSRSERFRIEPTDLDREVRVGLPQGASKKFRYRVTVVPKSGAMQPGEFIESTETLIAVAD
jgi:hypothetical protein